MMRDHKPQIREGVFVLDWLARNLHEWPAVTPKIILSGDEVFEHGANFFGDYVEIIGCIGLYTKDKWLSRRAELQNKPSWDDAPEWANWLAQDSASSNNLGRWCWFKCEPKPWSKTWQSVGSETATEGDVLGDWRDTLEKRPEACFKSMSGVHHAGDMLALHEELKDIDMNKLEPFVSVVDAATAKQPAPKGSGNPILGMVLADLTNRALEGKEKYGEPLLAHNGRNPLWDAYQEALDLAMYLRQAIEEQNKC